MLSDFIKTYFQEPFSRRRIAKGERFLEDGCPIQNSKKASQAFETVGAIKFSILSRSPEFNPIEEIILSKKYEL